MFEAMPLPHALPVRRRRRALLVGGTLGAPALLAGGLLLIAAITSTTLCTGVGQVLGGLKQTGKLTPDVHARDQRASRRALTSTPTS